MLLLAGAKLAYTQGQMQEGNEGISPPSVHKKLELKCIKNKLMPFFLLITYKLSFPLRISVSASAYRYLKPILSEIKQLTNNCTIF